MKEKLQQASAILAQTKLNDLSLGTLMGVANLIGQCLVELEQQGKAVEDKAKKEVK